MTRSIRASESIGCAQSEALFGDRAPQVLGIHVGPSARAPPDQKDEKSPDPCLSAFVLSGIAAWVASRKAGVSALSGPCSALKRLRIARAGRPVSTLVMTVAGSGFFSAVRGNSEMCASGQRR